MQLKIVNLKQLSKYKEDVQTAKFSQYNYDLNSIIITWGRWSSAFRLRVHFSHAYV